MFSENFQAPENRHNSSINSHFVCEQPVMILINIAKVLNIYMEFFLMVLSNIFWKKINFCPNRSQLNKKCLLLDKLRGKRSVQLCRGSKVFNMPSCILIGAKLSALEVFWNSCCSFTILPNIHTQIDMGVEKQKILR